MTKYSHRKLSQSEELHHNLARWADFSQSGPAIELFDDYETVAFTVGVNAEQDARHIIACVNACAGIPIDYLEAPETEAQAIAQKAYGEIVALREQQSNLLAALQSILDEDYSAPHDADNSDISFEKGLLIARNKSTARAAIALATGGAV